MNDLILGLAIIAGPIITLVVLGWQRRNDELRAAMIRADELLHKEEREDEVAAQVAKVAVAAAATAADQGKKLDNIHELVNNNLTESKQATYDMVVLLLASLRSQPSSPAVTVAIAVAEENLGALEHWLADRKVAQEKVDTGTAADATEPLGQAVSIVGTMTTEPAGQ